jgi:class 3 adenylate cyclase
VRVSVAAAPSGVVTFLFTDVEGSTRRWEADADGMRVALAVHDEVLRSAIEAHGGWYQATSKPAGGRESTAPRTSVRRCGAVAVPPRDGPVADADGRDLSWMRVGLA